MLLIDLISISTNQRHYIKSEISKGFLLITSIENSFANSVDPENLLFDKDCKYNFREMIRNAGLLCALFMDRDLSIRYLFGEAGKLQQRLVSLTKQAIKSKKQSATFYGSVWGVFCQQKRYLIISSPLKKEGRIFAGASIVINLEKIYMSQRLAQRIIVLYILINTAILTLIGVYRLSKLTVKPLQRLLKRAEEFKEDEEVFFLKEQENDEFSKLSGALNRMLKRISTDKENLKKTIASLEKANFDLKQAQKDLIRAEKLASVGRLSAGIAHEIGNPISIVIGYLELLKQQNISYNERKKFITRAEDEINRINIIIRQLLDFSRSSGEDEKPVSIHQIINDIAGVIDVQPFMSDIELELMLEAKTDTVMVNPDQLRQVFINLIINAADAIASMDRISNAKLVIASKNVSEKDPGSQSPHQMIKIEFIDNGPGICDKSLSDIFDPFYTTKEPGKGTGLGLYVCYMIISNMGGSIKAEGNEGQGTRIIVNLPVNAKIR